MAREFESLTFRHQCGCVRRTILDADVKRIGLTSSACRKKEPMRHNESGTGRAQAIGRLTGTVLPPRVGRVEGNSQVAGSQEVAPTW